MSTICFLLDVTDSQLNYLTEFSFSSHLSIENTEIQTVRQGTLKKPVEEVIVTAADHLAQRMKIWNWEQSATNIVPEFFEKRKFFVYKLGHEERGKKS